MRYATLVTDDFPLPSWPPGQAPVADDPTARCLLRRAQGAFQKWPEGFAGFRAAVSCETPHGVKTGQVTVTRPDGVGIDCDDDGLHARLHDMLSGIIVDRTPRFFDEGDGRFPISFVDAPGDSVGQSVNVHARLGQLRYWIDTCGRIRQIERIARGLRVLTTFEAFIRTTPGRVLPTQSTTCTWDVANGTLLHSESVHDSHRRIEHVWLPSARRISGNAGGTPVVLSLLDHELL